MPSHRNGNRTKQSEDTGHALMPYGGGSTGLMTQIRDEFDRMFERFFRNFGGMGPTRGGSSLSPFLGEGWGGGMWGLDVQEDDEQATVRAELPGFNTNDIDVNVSDNRMVIHAAHQGEESQEKGHGRTWQQREYYQVVTLPPGVDADKIDAEYTNGVLTVTVPKTEQSKGRKVNIRHGGKGNQNTGNADRGEAGR